MDIVSTETKVMLLIILITKLHYFNQIFIKWSDLKTGVKDFTKLFVILKQSSWLYHIKNKAMCEIESI